MRSRYSWGAKVDSRTRSGLLAVQFDRLADGQAEQRSVVFDADVARITLTRFDNVMSCTCELRRPSPEGFEALRRRGALEDTFMISRKLPPREFGSWLDRLLVEDLGADPEHEVRVLELEPTAS
jgi:hypothetical protein